MPSHRIVDASPLILLAKVGRLDLLRAGVDAVIAPDVVRREVRAKGSADPVARAVDAITWLEFRPVSATPDLSMCGRLDAGEEAVLALALEGLGVEIVLDDLAGRTCARRLGIPCLGTFGLVLLARQLDIIPAARPVVMELRKAGLYLHDALAEEVLRSSGE